MKRNLLTVVMLLASTLFAFAQTTNDELENELNKLFDLKANSETVLESFGDQLGPIVESGFLSAEEAANMQKELVDALMPAIMEGTKKLYREAFSLDELKQINAFLGSEIGKKMIRVDIESSANFAALLKDPANQKKWSDIFTKYFPQ